MLTFYFSGCATIFIVLLVFSLLDKKRHNFTVYDLLLALSCAIGSWFILPVVIVGWIEPKPFSWLSKKIIKSKNGR